MGEKEGGRGTSVNEGCVRRSERVGVKEDMGS